MDHENFESIREMIDYETQLREKIKDQVTELDKKTRIVVGMLNRIHSTPPNDVPVLMENVQPVLFGCQAVMAVLAELIPPNEFWRWKDMWSNSLRTAVFAAALVEYLLYRRLIVIDRVSEILGIKQDWRDRISLPPEDYLHGLINLVNELSRLAVNAVTMRNFDEPIKISLFVKDLYAGFSMLNLKNDTLRRRFDSLKYDMKKIEEVVYDVALRRLTSASVPAQ